MKRQSISLLWHVDELRRIGLDDATIRVASHQALVAELRAVLDESEPLRDDLDLNPHLCVLLVCDQVVERVLARYGHAWERGDVMLYWLTELAYGRQP